jgi:hypothetical protein
VIVIRVHHHVQVQIVQPVVPMVIAIPVQAPVHLPIVVIDQPVVHTQTATRVHLPIVHVAKTHTVAIAHARAMTATHVRLRATANAVAVQIVPEVVFPMIAKNVHAVALAKSA